MNYSSNYVLWIMYNAVVCFFNYSKYALVINLHITNNTKYKIIQYFNWIVVKQYIPLYIAI